MFGVEKMPKGIIRSSFFEPWREEAGLAATPAYFALRAQRLLRESDLTKEHLAQVVVKNRRHGVHNPNAMFRKEVDAEAVLALKPRFDELFIGVVGPHASGSPYAFEVRGFFPSAGAMVEDPVTGSLNASLAGWLLRTGYAQAPYVARQGTAIGRAGDVYISVDGSSTIWVAGGTVTCVSGTVQL